MMACRVTVAHSASTLPELVPLVPRRLSRARCRAGTPAARSTLPDSARLETNKMMMARVGTSQRRLMTRVAATDEDAGSSDQDDLPEFFCLDFYQAAGRSVADARWFNTYLQGAVFVGILGFVDAGYSGDWSRIGAISTELEAKLRFYALVLLGVHVVAAAAAGKVAQSRGLPVAPAVGKTFAVGFLAFLETCFKTAPGKA